MSRWVMLVLAVAFMATLTPPAYTQPISYNDTVWMIWYPQGQPPPEFYRNQANAARNLYFYVGDTFRLWSVIKNQSYRLAGYTLTYVIPDSTRYYIYTYGPDSTGLPFGPGGYRGPLDDNGNPDFWWQMGVWIWNNPYTYGVRQSRYAHLAVELTGPMATMPQSTWLVGFAKFECRAPGATRLDTGVYPPSNRFQISAWGGTTYHRPQWVQPFITITTPPPPVEYDTLPWPSQPGDTVVVTSPSSGDWVVDVIAPGLNFVDESRPGGSFRIVFDDISMMGPFSFSYYIYSPGSLLMPRFWYLHFGGVAQSYDIQFWYNDGDLYDTHNDPIDETNLVLYRWDWPGPLNQVTPTNVSITNNYIAVTGWTGGLSNWGIGNPGATYVSETPGKPSVFYLKQNKPNPFKEHTTISFGLPKNAHVDIAVYNNAGQRVKTIVRGDLNSGYYNIMWNGTDDSGNKLPSGVYFLKMEAETFKALRKMIIVR